MLTERELAVLHGKLTAADTPLDGVAVVLTAQAKESVMLKLISCSLVAALVPGAILTKCYCILW